MKVLVDHETKEVTTIEKVPVYRVTLTREQAEFIYALTYRIGGSEKTTYRNISDELRKGLGDAGVSASWYDYFDTGSMVCADRT